MSAAAGWVCADIEAEKWWLIALAIVIGASVWIATYSYGRYLHFNGYAAGTVDEMKREIERRKNR